MLKEHYRLFAVDVSNVAEVLPLETPIYTQWPPTWYERFTEETKDWTPADWAIYTLKDLIPHDGSYAETYLIENGGSLNLIERIDGISPYLINMTHVNINKTQVNTIEELYGLAAQVEARYAEYHFTFDVDPEGKWIRYSVTKD